MLGPIFPYSKYYPTNNGEEKNPTKVPFGTIAVPYKVIFQCLSGEERDKRF